MNMACDLYTYWIVGWYVGDVYTLHVVMLLALVYGQVVKCNEDGLMDLCMGMCMCYFTRNMKIIMFLVFVW